MMTQTFAILLDAYRELQSKKMFWIVLILNLLVVAAFSIIGANDHTITVLWFEPLGDLRNGLVAPLFMYKVVFSYLVVGIWFTWIASLLALISTAGIFPDFLSSGSVDLFLAKPLSRLRLFFTKYLAGLLFVLLQVTLFTTLSFFVLGIRAGLWEAGLFLAIPLVVVFFSYLYSICVLMGTWTRSTVAALLLTILAWFGIWAIDRAETTVTAFRQSMELQQALLDDSIEDYNAKIELTKKSEDQSALPDLERLRTAAIDARKQNEVSPALIITQNVAYGIKSFVPKTRETINLLDRVLFKDQELKDAARHPDAATAPAMSPEFQRRRGGQRFEARQAEQINAARTRPVWWIIGTSLLFEALCLALAAWYFCTRDF